MPIEKLKSGLVDMRPGKVKLLYCIHHWGRPVLIKRGILISGELFYVAGTMHTNSVQIKGDHVLIQSL